MDKDVTGSSSERQARSLSVEKNNFILGHPPQLGMSVSVEFALMEKHVSVESCIGA